MKEGTVKITTRSTPDTRAAKRDRIAQHVDSGQPLKVRWDRVMVLVLSILGLAVIASQLWVMHVMTVTSGL